MALVNHSGMNLSEHIVLSDPALNYFGFVRHNITGLDINGFFLGFNTSLLLFCFQIGSCCIEQAEQPPA